MSRNGYRTGTLVKPQDRLSPEQVKTVHRASMEMLDDPGILCFNMKAAQFLANSDCKVSKEKEGIWRIQVPEKAVMLAAANAPKKVVLGARNPENKLLLDTDDPVVYFGTGAETNIYLKSEMARFVREEDHSVQISYPVFSEDRGSIHNLCESAKLCNNLENVDFFIRNVNIQDEEISPANKDVNVYMACLLYMTKHIQGGVTSLDGLEDILEMARIVAGGEEELRENPLLSFITCIMKSPLQMVDDTTEKLMAISKRGVPAVISSSPQGGSNAPIEEEGVLAMINAEIMAGVVLTQAVNPGAPVIYGSVPVRTRLDNLHDLYGAPEFIHYNVGGVQMAKFYGIPCYSSAGVGDAKVPGIQATVEKLFSLLDVPAAGPHYVHYAFGLLDKTNVFSPLQAVLDDAHIDIVRAILRKPSFGEQEASASVKQVRKVMDSSTQLFARFIRKAMRRGLVSYPYAFETDSDSDLVMEKAHKRLEEILSGPDERLNSDLEEEIRNKVSGILPSERFAV